MCLYMCPIFTCSQLMNSFCCCCCCYILEPKLYRCEICQKNFAGASGLWYHNKHVHGAETQKYQKSKRGKKRTSAAQSQVIAKKKTRFEEHNSWEVQLSVCCVWCDVLGVGVGRKKNQDVGRSWWNLTTRNCTCLQEKQQITCTLVRKKENICMYYLFLSLFVDD